MAFLGMRPACVSRTRRYIPAPWVEHYAFEAPAVWESRRRSKGVSAWQTAVALTDIVGEYDVAGMNPYPKRRGDPMARLAFERGLRHAPRRGARVAKGDGL